MSVAAISERLHRGELSETAKRHLRMIKIIEVIVYAALSGIALYALYTRTLIPMNAACALVVLSILSLMVGSVIKKRENRIIVENDPDRPQAMQELEEDLRNRDAQIRKLEYQLESSLDAAVVAQKEEAWKETVNTAKGESAILQQSVDHLKGEVESLHSLCAERHDEIEVLKLSVNVWKSETDRLGVVASERSKECTSLTYKNAEQARQERGYLDQIQKLERELADLKQKEVKSESPPVENPAEKPVEPELSPVKLERVHIHWVEEEESVLDFFSEEFEPLPESSEAQEKKNKVIIQVSSFSFPDAPKTDTVFLEYCQAVLPLIFTPERIAQLEKRERLTFYGILQPEKIFTNLNLNSQERQSIARLIMGMRRELHMWTFNEGKYVQSCNYRVPTLETVLFLGQLFRRKPLSKVESAEVIQQETIESGKIKANLIKACKEASANHQEANRLLLEYFALRLPLIFTQPIIRDLGTKEEIASCFLLDEPQHAMLVLNGLQPGYKSMNLQHKESREIVMAVIRELRRDLGVANTSLDSVTVYLKGTKFNPQTMVTILDRSVAKIKP